MARPICSCGMVMYSHAGISACIHCDDAPQISIINCYQCRVYRHTVDARLKAEHLNERTNQEQP